MFGLIVENLSMLLTDGCLDTVLGRG